MEVVAILWMVAAAGIYGVTVDWLDHTFGYGRVQWIDTPIFVGVMFAPVFVITLVVRGI